MLSDSVFGTRVAASPPKSWLRQAQKAARRRIVAAIAGSAMAVLAITAALFLHQAAVRRQAIGEQAGTISKGAAAILDRKIATAKALLNGLASSPALRSHDFETFEQQMTETTRPEGSWLGLFDNEGNPLLYSSTVAYEARPTFIWRDFTIEAIGHGGAAVSDLIPAPPGYHDAVAIGVPILQNGRAEYVLLMSIGSASLGSIFDDLTLPPQWAGVVFDRRGNVIAGRHREADGKNRACADLANRLNGASAGAVLQDRGRRGGLVTAVPAAESSWISAVDVPAETVAAPLRNALLFIAVAAAAVILAGIALAAWMARRHNPLSRMTTLVAKLEESERAADALYRAYWNHTAEGIFVYEVTSDGRFLLEALNPAHEKLSGIRIDIARGREPHEFLSAEAAAQVTPKYQRCIETGVPMRYEQELSMPAGVRTWETVLVPVQDPNTGRISRLLGSCREISEQKRFLAALSESEQRFHHIADGAPVLIWISGPDKGATYFNKPWLDFTGHSLETELGTGWLEGVHPEDLTRCLAIYESHFDRRAPFRMEYRLRRADGQYRWMDDSGVPRFGPAGDFLGYIGSAVDVNDRRATEQALRYLAGRLLQVQDDERRRIARDLHDSTAQNLLGAILGIRRALRLDRDMPAEAKKVLEESHDLIRQVEGEVRTTCYLLHPPMLDEAGLPAAVRWYAEGFAKRSRIKVDIDIAAELSGCRLPHDVEIALFRVVQEALTNVRRHSGSKKARLSLARSKEESISLTIEDDGRGMTDAATAFAASKPNGGLAGLGVGIAGMSERLRQFGGSLHIHSRSRGVRVTAVVPIGPEQQH